ncbi:MAG: hypothetical protein ACR2MO_01960 [Acidimicrobiales bacterium]
MVGDDRFAAGWRLLLDDEASPAGERAPQARAGITVDVVRPADLVALSFTAEGCELVGGEPPVLRPTQTARAARLTVTLAYQHLAEQAVYEGDVNPPDPNDPAGANVRPSPPVKVRPSKASRLVFAVPPDETIEFSTAGLLGALGRLELVVHPLATPAPGLLVAPSADTAPVLHLPGNLVAMVTGEGTVVSRPPAGLKAPRLSDVDRLLTTARDLRRARTALLATGGTVAGRQVDLGPLTGAVSAPVGPRPRPRAGPVYSRPAEEGETAIEAPFRLVISPSVRGGWAHAADPVRAGDAPGHVELWHTRLGVRKEHADGTVSVDERSTAQRKVRAVWARDREGMGAWQNVKVPVHDNLPFRMSLDGADRHMLVRQSAETWPGRRGVGLIPPEPVDARELWLSALGAWLDLHGDWVTAPYSVAAMSSILAWDHEAPFGRDQYVRVEYPGFLFPIGHRAVLVKVTERKMKDAAPSLAALYQRKFIVIGEPLRTYADRHELPFTGIRVAPLVTPTIDDPTGAEQNSFFWPRVGGKEFPFVLHSRDHEGRPVKLVTPLLWVAEHATAEAAGRTALEAKYATSALRKVPTHGQQIAFAPASKGGDTTNDTESVFLMGTAHAPPLTSTPRMTQARVRLPAVERISGIGPVPVRYADPYKANGFGAANAGQVWAETVTADNLKELASDEVAALPVMRFGSGAPAGSDRSGGFLAPDQPIRGLSRLSGAVGDVGGMATQKFDPAAFLAGALPKLFGLVDLVQLLDAVGGVAPNLINEALDRAEGFVADLQRARQQAAEAVSEADKLVDRALSKTAELQAAAQDALAKAQQAKTSVEGAVDDFIALLGGLAGQAEAAVEAALAAPLVTLRAAVGDIEAAAPTLPPLIRSQLTSLAKVLRQVLDAADLVNDLYRLLNGLAQSGIETRFRFEWKPKLKSWPSAAKPILEVKADSLMLSVEGRVSGKGEVGAEILAELKDFTLHLLPGAPLVRIPFDHLSFKSGSSGKAEVDVVMREIEFVGVLSFVETLKDLIPFDGFSDPPFLEVTPAGVTAGFTLELPSVAIGVFTLANISLGADVNVPFLGKTVTVGFDFCKRENPFTLTVMMIGGGGWFGIRISPDGLDVMELGLEAGACLAIDLGVASGSVSIMVGIYMRLEGDKGSLTGYFRIRGEVDVLGLISASIELYLELRYEFDTGKMVGKASLTISIKVFVFSGSVKIEVERKLAGSNGDPTLAQVMDVQNGQSPHWSDYCLAFAEA